jgi:hypothetical protein
VSGQALAAALERVASSIAASGVATFSRDWLELQLDDAA